MSASFKVELESLKFFMRKISDPKLNQRLDNIQHEKGAVAIISQAIADNFNQEGPGWPPLKTQTIRRSVKGKTKKAVSDMTDKEVERHEASARRNGSKVMPFRKILQLSGLLKKTVTVAGYTGTSKGAHGKPGPTGSNVYRVENQTIVWGTNLPYAGAHNNGAPKQNIPKREFLVIRPEWQSRLEEWTMTTMIRYLREAWGEILG